MEKTKDPGANPRVVQMVQQRHFAKNVRRVTLPAATLIRAKYSVEKTFDCSAAAQQTLLCKTSSNLGRKPPVLIQKPKI